MKSKIRSIHVIPTALLLLLFVTNLYLGYINYPKSNYPKFFLFSIAYLILGIILWSKMRFAVLIGFVFTLLIVFIYPVIIDFKDLNSWSTGFMSAFNVIIIISCGILLLLKIKD